MEIVSRFVRPETRTLTISNGDTLVVKKRLNAGEQRAQFARRYTQLADGALRVNPFQTGLALVTAYLLDWSLRYPDGSPIVIREKPIDEVERLLDTLSPEDFAEIREAIERHEDEMARERADARKKTLGGENEFAATSPSPSAAAGASSGSES